MELDLPPREKPSREGFPATPRGVRKWLAELGALEVREVTRRFSEGVHALNRLQIPPRRRLRIMEQLRPTAREVLDHLAGRVHAQALPLPERTRRVFELNIDLLRELALGYEIALVGDGGRSRRRTALAAERALARHGERMLRSAQVYAPLDEHFWQRPHAVYARAEQARATEHAVGDGEFAASPKARHTPAAVYKRLLLFAVAQTEGLRKTDSERIYRALEGWQASARLITPGGEADDAEHWFAVDLGAPRAPIAWRLRPEHNPPGLRALDVTHSLEAAEQALEASRAAERENAVDPDRISSVALERLVDHWRQRAMRRAARESQGDAVEVALTLGQIHAQLAEPPTPEPEVKPRRPPTAYTETATLTLQTIERDEERAAPGYVTHPGFADADGSGEAWDDVGRGRARSPGFVQARAEAEQERVSHKAHPDRPRWLLDDTSHTGFRLRWAGEGSSRATVGELLAMRVPGPEGEHWRLGVVRWMQFIDDSQFLAGCHAIASRIVPAGVRREPANPNRRRRRDEEHVEPALLLPGSRARGERATLVVPAHMFREGEAVELDLREKTLRVLLAQVHQNTGSFTQFGLEPAPRERPPAGGARGNGEPTVWDSL